MTPEELANARALLPVPIGSGQTIKASGDAAVRRRKVVEMFPELIAHIDAQAAQIEALKETLVSVTTTSIWRASYDSLEGKFTISDVDARKLARQCLAEDPKLKAAGVTFG